MMRRPIHHSSVHQLRNQGFTGIFITDRTTVGRTTAGIKVDDIRGPNRVEPALDKLAVD